MFILPIQHRSVIYDLPYMYVRTRFRTSEDLQVVFN